MKASIYQPSMSSVKTLLPLLVQQENEHKWTLQCSRAVLPISPYCKLSAQMHIK